MFITCAMWVLLLPNNYKSQRTYFVCYSLFDTVALEDVCYQLFCVRQDYI